MNLSSCKHLINYYLSRQLKYLSPKFVVTYYVCQPDSWIAGDIFDPPCNSLVQEFVDLLQVDYLFHGKGIFGNKDKTLRPSNFPA